MFFENTLLFNIAENSVADPGRGGFARKIVALSLAEPDYPDNQAFLSRVLAAAQINLEKDTLFAELEPAAGLKSLLPLLKTKKPDHILVFGLTPRQLGLNIEAPLYAPLEFYGLTWLFADRLSQLEPDKNRKGQLWRALQQLFL